MADIQLPDGNVIRIPDFALDSTAQKMLNELQKQTKGMSGQLKLLVENAKKDSKEANKDRKEADKDRDAVIKATQELADAMEKSKGSGVMAFNSTGLDRFNKGAALGEKAFVKFYDGAVGAAKYLSAGFILYGGYVIDSFLGLGQTLNDMTKAGVGFGDGVAAGGMTATQALERLSGAGLDGSRLMMQFSNAVQLMGKQSFTRMTESFLDATNAGADLGMSLEDSADRLGRELERRRAMGLLDNMNQQQLQKQITTSIKRQQEYANAVGESTDTLVAFADSLLERTPTLTSSLLRLDNDLRGKVVAGISDFGAAMRAMGGEEGGEIAMAFTEAAASGAMGFSDSMTGYIQALPSLAPTMNKYIGSIQNGTLSQDDANAMAQDLAGQLSNLSESEKQRIFALDRAGNAQAASMARAITQFEQTEKRIKDMNAGLTMSGVQAGTNVLTSIFKEFSGTIEAFKLSFLEGLGGAATGADSLKEAFAEVKKSIGTSIGTLMNSFGFAGDAVDGLTGAGKSLGEQLGERLPSIIKAVGEKVSAIITSIGNWLSQFQKDGKFDFSEMIKSIKTSMLDGLKSMILDVGKHLILAIAGIQILKIVSSKLISGLAGPMDAISKGVGKIISNLAKGVGNAVTAVLGAVGKAMTNIGRGIAGLSKGIGNTFTSLVNAVSKGVSSIATAISNVVSSIGKGLGGLIQGTLTGVGKGLAALGNPKAMLGSVTLGLLAGVMFLAAKSFQAFADVSWDAIGKGFVALLGLGAVSAVLGLALPLIIPGAVAIGALGLALVPFAAAAMLAAPAMDTITDSLIRLKDVDITTLLGIGPAMVGLAAGMAALSAGGLIGSVLDGLGSLFGGDSPVDKLMKLGEAAPAVNALSENMKGFGDNVATFNDALSQIRGDVAASEFVKIADALEVLNGQMDDISLVKIMRMSALKMFGGGGEQEQPGITNTGTSSTANAFSDTNIGINGPEIASITNRGVSQTTSAVPSTSRRQDRITTTAQQNDNFGTTEPGSTEGEGSGMETGVYNANPGNMSTILREMLDAQRAVAAKQEETNRLLRRGNRTSEEINSNL